VDCGRSEVVVGGQKLEIVPAAELDQEGVNGADLNAMPPTGIADFCCVDHDSRDRSAL